MPWLISLLTGSAVFLVVWGLFRQGGASAAPVHRRMALALGIRDRETVFESPLLAPPLAMALEVAQRMGFPALRQRVRRDLDASGNPSGYSVEEYVAICLSCGVVAALLTALVGFLLMGAAAGVLAVTFAVLAGFCMPLLALRQQAQARAMRISKQLPYTLDLVSLMMAAGSTFTEAIDVVVRDNPDDDLNQELRIVQAEIELGTNRAQALQNMAQRVSLDTLYSIVGAINQSEALGTPLATILKSQSSTLRLHRSVRAEKLSASASLRILVPSVLILAAVVLFIFGPMIIRYKVYGSWMLK